MASNNEQDTLEEMKQRLLDRFRSVDSNYGEYDPEALQAMGTASRAYTEIIEQQRKLRKLKPE